MSESDAVSGFKRRFGWVGEALVDALPKFPLDVVGVVADYAREARLVHSFVLQPNMDKQSRERYHRQWFIAVNACNAIFVSDSDRVRVFGPNEKFLRELHVAVSPCGIVFDTEGHTLIADDLNKCVLVPGPDGSLLRNIVPLDSDGVPCGMAEHQGELFICNGQQVQVFHRDGSFRRQFGSFERAWACVCSPSGELFVSDAHSITVWDTQGKLLRPFGSGDCVADPHGLAFDHAGNLLVCNLGNGCLTSFRPDGTFLWSFNDQLHQPTGVCVDSAGRIYVCERVDDPVRVLVI